MGELLPGLPYLRNLRVAGAPCLSGELLFGLRYFRNVSCDADRSRKVKYCLDYRTSETNGEVRTILQVVNYYLIYGTSETSSLALAAGRR